jgi:predicted MPP superfamily phosphohydrolase
MQMKNRFKAARRCALLSLAAALLGVFVWWNNCALTVSYVQIEAETEDGVKILHLSDVHGAWFGKEQNRIAECAEKTEPDVIVITGDFVDRRCDERAAVRLIERLAEIVPVY